MNSQIRKTPYYHNWALSTSSDQHNTQSFMAYHARVYQLLMYIDVLIPDFIEKDGYVLRVSAIPEDWDLFLGEAKDANWEKSSVEYAINHIHVKDLFLNDPDVDTIDDDVFNFIADVISSSWNWRLKQLFPQKHFEVAVKERDWNPEVYAVEII